MKWLTAKQVAEKTGYSVRTLEWWRLAMHDEYVGPPYLKRGRTIRYPLDGVEAWMLQNEQARRVAS